MTCRSRFGLALLAVMATFLGAQPAGMESLRAIPDPERRSREALAFAQEQFEVALESYADDRGPDGRAGLGRMADAVELSVESLRATGKHPRRHPRHFKRAEISTRRLIERIRDAQRKAHLQDQPDFDGPIGRVEKSNAQLLLGIMAPRK